MVHKKYVVTTSSKVMESGWVVSSETHHLSGPQHISLETSKSSVRCKPLLSNSQPNSMILDAEMQSGPIISDQIGILRDFALHPDCPLN